MSRHSLKLFYLNFIFRILLNAPNIGLFFSFSGQNVSPTVKDIRFKVSRLKFFFFFSISKFLLHFLDLCDLKIILFTFDMRELIKIWLDCYPNLFKLHNFKINHSHFTSQSLLLVFITLVTVSIPLSYASIQGQIENSRDRMKIRQV